MHRIIIQYAADKTLAPKASLLRRYANTALDTKFPAAEITIRIVDVNEMSELNSHYRQKQGATNVLSFPFTLPDDVELDIPLLGDIVICADVVNREAKEQGKERDAHWAHMIVHGVFHLLGYDHELDHEADIMEAQEITVMQTLGFSNPYQAGEDITQYD